MTGYVTNIEQDTLENKDYRRVLYTGRNMQLVLMTLQPGEEIGLEIHEEHDQFIRVEAGTGVVLLDGEKRDLSVLYGKIAVGILLSIEKRSRAGVKA